MCVEVDLSEDADFAAMLAAARTAFGHGTQAERGQVERRVRFFVIHVRVEPSPGTELAE